MFKQANPMLAQIVGTGCMLGGLLAASIGICGFSFSTLAKGQALMTLASRVATLSNVMTFKNNLLNAINVLKIREVSWNEEVLQHIW